MQITESELHPLGESAETLDLSMQLVHVSRSAIMDLAGEALDLALAIATAALPTPGPPNPVTRVPLEEP